MHKQEKNLAICQYNSFTVRVQVKDLLDGVEESDIMTTLFRRLEDLSGD
jgi:hypothetical protein